MCWRYLVFTVAAALAAAALAVAARHVARVGWRLAALDALGELAEAAAAPIRRASAACTARCDPLGVSRRPITVGGRTFRVAAGCDADRRVVAWLYRWHPAPDIYDWLDSLAAYGLRPPAAGCPPYTILLDGDRAIDIQMWPDADGRWWRRLTYRAGRAAARTVSGRLPLGGLDPGRMLRDALGAPEQAAAPQPPTHLSYAPLAPTAPSELRWRIRPGGP
jgi:hypothetical protein